MKLTNQMRTAFIRAAMADVPSVDYQEQIRKEVLAAYVAALPPKVRVIYNNEETRDYVATTYRSHSGFSAYVPGPASHKTVTLPQEHLKKLTDLSDKLNAQLAQLGDLEKKLKGAAYAATTRKALVEMLPEFEKYLPADEAVVNRTLPVVQNIVADFVKAGWPKGKKVEVKK